jgi:hypothetical protein
LLSVDGARLQALRTLCLVLERAPPLAVRHPA